jgi:hypothetical protein
LQAYDHRARQPLPPFWQQRPPYLHLGACGVNYAFHVLANTGFTLRLAAKVETIPAPEHSVVELIRRLDPLRVHEKEIRAEDMRRGFSIA